MVDKDKFIAKITSIFTDYNIGSIADDFHGDDVFADPDNMDSIIHDISYLIDVVPVEILYEAISVLRIEFDTSEVQTSFVDDKSVLSDYIDKEWFNEIINEIN